jgi:hypothetical protein
MTVTAEGIAIIAVKPIVMIMMIMAMTIAVVIIIVFETSVLQEIVHDRRSRAGINIGREKMIQLSPIQIVRRHALILFDIFGVRNAERSFKLTPRTATTARFRPLALHNGNLDKEACQSQSMVDGTPNGTLAFEIFGYTVANEQRPFQSKSVQRLR